MLALRAVEDDQRSEGIGANSPTTPRSAKPAIGHDFLMGLSALDDCAGQASGSRDATLINQEILSGYLVRAAENAERTAQFRAARAFPLATVRSVGNGCVRKARNALTVRRAAIGRNRGGRWS